MLAYAFEALTEDSYSKIATEKFQYIGDLFAAILAKGIANQIKKGLGREYVSNTATLSSPIGKINVSDSVKRHTMLNKQLVCEFDDFTENAYLNQILKTTAMLLIRSPEISLQHKKALRKVMLYFAGVDEIDPRRIQWSHIKYHRNNGTYRMLVNICYLIITGMLLTEQRGSRKLARYLDDQRHSGQVSGILLYAKTDEDIVPDNDYMMSGNRISVKTLDLNADFEAIENQLGKVVANLLN